MSNKALIVTINSLACQLISSKLSEIKNPPKEIIEFIDSFRMLDNNEYRSLILNKSEDNFSGNNESIICYDELQIKLKERSVYYNSDLIKLTPKEFDILYLLASNKGIIFSKEEIYNKVWQETYSFDDSNIISHIRKLRKKIEPDTNNPRYIITIWGVGYKFGNK